MNNNSLLSAYITCFSDEISDEIPVIREYLNSLNEDDICKYFVTRNCKEGLKEIEEMDNTIESMLSDSSFLYNEKTKMAEYTKYFMLRSEGELILTYDGYYQLPFPSWIKKNFCK